MSKCSWHGDDSPSCMDDCQYREHSTHASLKELLCKKYGEPIGEGRHRITFASKRVVIKMPKSVRAIAAQESEYWRYKNPRPEDMGRLARCRIVMMFNVPVIVMEKLDIMIHEKKPEWSWTYDCGQVGKDRKGQYKAYDYTTC